MGLPWYQSPYNPDSEMLPPYVLSSEKERHNARKGTFPAAYAKRLECEVTASLCKTSPLAKSIKSNS